MKKVVKVYYLLDKSDIKSIKKQLIDLDMTYAMLAKKIGVCTSYISGILSGHKHFTDKVKNQFNKHGIIINEK